MATDNGRFERYLVGELFWELEQHQPRPSSFVGIQPDAVEVLAVSGYHDMRIRVEAQVFEVHLSRRKDVPPDIRKVEGI